MLTISNEIEQVVNQEETQEMIKYTFAHAENEDKMEQLDLHMKDNEEGVIVAKKHSYQTVIFCVK